MLARLDFTGASGIFARVTEASTHMQTGRAGLGRTDEASSRCTTRQPDARRPSAHPCIAPESQRPTARRADDDCRGAVARAPGAIGRARIQRLVAPIE